MEEGDDGGGERVMEAGWMTPERTGPHTERER